MDDPNKAKVGQIEALGNDLGADDDVDCPVVELLVALLDRLLVIGITIKSSDDRFGKESPEFAFDKLRTNALMNDVSMLTFWTARGNTLGGATYVADKLMGVTM